MNEFSLLNVKEYWPLLTRFGYNHPFFNLTISTLTATWIVLVLIVLLIVVGRFFLNSKESKVRYVLMSGTQIFMDLCTQTLGSFQYEHFSFVFALFIFILLCNTVSIIPELEEPTSDLSTALALGIISFLYANYYEIKTHGIRAYIKEFFQPFFIMFPLNVVGKLASIISISFRLFGNMLGGAVISNIYVNAVSSHWVGWIVNFTGLNLTMAFFFSIFEGGIQAFVFSMLSLTYLSLGIQSDDIEDN
jgi:F-type H+-transporting ATPase subunit a